MIAFALEAADGAARAGTLTFPAAPQRGPVQTPAFMPVGTRATVKAVTSEELQALGAGIVLANTYHLHLRPGEQVIRGLGGLHRFMAWPGAILTDSGGYQLHSLAAQVRVDEEGARFRSHLDGTALTLTPESAIGIQEALGADIMMCLDHLVSLPRPEAELEAAVARTTRWAARCKAARTGPAALFGIVQGGTAPALRRRSAEELCAIGFDGYALGGLSVGEDRAATHETLAATAPLLPAAQPRYVMGMGEPADLLAAIAAGADMFDCVLPTRNARNGTLYTRRGKVNIKQARHAADPAPLDPDCPCPTCTSHSRAYLRHLFATGEILAMRLNTLHNLHFYFDLMRQARTAIVAQRYDKFAKDFLEGFGG